MVHVIFSNNPPPPKQGLTYKMLLDPVHVLAHTVVGESYELTDPTHTDFNIVSYDFGF